MRKPYLVVIALGIVAVACSNQNPVGPGNVETITRASNGAPTVEIMTPTDQSEFAAGVSVNFSATANDSGDGNVSDSIAWSSSLDGDLGTGAFIMSSLTAGTHDITASASDEEGLVGSATVTVIVGATAPVVTIVSPKDGAAVSAGTAVTFVGTAVDAEDGDLTASLAWTSSIDGSIGTGGTVTETPSEGTHFITASATDGGSLVGNAAISITVAPVQNTVPTVEIASPDDGAEFPTGTVLTFVGSATDAEDGDLSASIKWIQARSEGPLTLGTGPSLMVALNDGTWSISANVTDSGDLDGVAAITVKVGP